MRNWLIKRRLQHTGISPFQFVARPDHDRNDCKASQRELSARAYARPTSEQLRQLLHARQARGDFFGSHLFSDPAWDILLLAYVATLDGQQLFVNAVCGLSPVPATTALRWIKELERAGWLKCGNNPLDDPTASVELSAAGKAAMENYLTLVWPLMPL